MNCRGQSKRHLICRGKLLSAHHGGAGRRCYGATCLTWNRSIAVHGAISGPKDRFRAVDRYRARSYRSKRLELRFAVAVHSPIAVHGPITVQHELFKFPRRNVPLGICLSTDFSAFSSFRRETCESTSLSALIFVPFQEQKKVWRGLPGIFVRCLVLFFSFFFFVRYRALSFQKEERQGLARDSLV